MYEPAAAPLSPIVIGLPPVRLVLSANAYRLKLVGAAKPFATLPVDQLPNDSDPPAPKPSCENAVPDEDMRSSFEFHASALFHGKKPFEKNMIV